jgi:hypothetical protein
LLALPNAIPLFHRLESSGQVVVDHKVESTRSRC